MVEITTYNDTDITVEETEVIEKIINQINTWYRYFASTGIRRSRTRMKASYAPAYDFEYYIWLPWSLETKEYINSFSEKILQGRNAVKFDIVVERETARYTNQIIPHIKRTADAKLKGLEKYTFHVKIKPTIVGIDFHKETVKLKVTCQLLDSSFKVASPDRYKRKTSIKKKTEEEENKNEQ